MSIIFRGLTISSPARCGLLTGRHAGHAQIRANDEMEWRGDVWNHEAMLRDSTLEGQAPLEAGTPTLGSVMQQAGYATAMIGKWGVGGPATEGTPNKMGFGTYYGCICQRQAHTFYPNWLWKNDEKTVLTGKEYSQDLIHRQALTFIRSNANKPFFAYITYTLPHAGLEQPDDSILKIYS